MHSISKLLQAVGNRGVSGLRFRAMNQMRLDSLHLHARRLAIYKQSGKPRLARQTAALVVARHILYEMSGSVNQSIEEHQANIDLIAAPRVVGEGELKSAANNSCLCILLADRHGRRLAQAPPRRPALRRARGDAMAQRRSAL